MKGWFAFPEMGEGEVRFSGAWHVYERCQIEAKARSFARYEPKLLGTFQNQQSAENTIIELRAQHRLGADA